MYAAAARDTSEREWSSFMILKLCYYSMIKRLLLVSICFFFSIAKTSYVFFFMLYIIMIFIIWSKVGFRGLLFF